MKKLLALLLSLSMVFFCACGSDTNLETLETSPKGVVENVIKSETRTDSFDPSEYLEKISEEHLEEQEELIDTIEELDEEIKHNDSPNYEYNVSEPAPAIKETSQIVYVTRTGSKYHSYGCQYLKKSCIEKDLSVAQSQGYTPCSKCY